MQAIDSEALRDALPDGGTVALLDWDNSLIDGYTVQMWAHFLADREHAPREYPDTIDDLIAAHHAGELEFVPFARRVEETYLRWEPNLPEEHGREMGDAFAAEAEALLMSWTRPLLEAVKKQGWEPVVLSGAPGVPLAAFGRKLGFRYHIAWALTVTGLGEPELTWGNTALDSVKQAVVDEVAARCEVAFALGDSDADAPMLNAARTALRVRDGQLTLERGEAGDLGDLGPLVASARSSD